MPDSAPGDPTPFNDFVAALDIAMCEGCNQLKQIVADHDPFREDVWGVIYPMDLCQECYNNRVREV